MSTILAVLESVFTESDENQTIAKIPSSRKPPVSEEFSETEQTKRQKKKPLSSAGDQLKIIPQKSQMSKKHKHHKRATKRHK